MARVERYRDSELFNALHSPPAHTLSGFETEIMSVFELTKALIDIPSVTPEEEQVGDFLFAVRVHDIGCREWLVEIHAHIERALTHE